METVHITPERPFSADDHLLTVLNKSEDIERVSHITSNDQSTASINESSPSKSSLTKSDDDQAIKQKPSGKNKSSLRNSLRKDSSIDVHTERVNQELNENEKINLNGGDE